MMIVAFTTLFAPQSLFVADQNQLSARQKSRRSMPKPLIVRAIGKGLINDQIARKADLPGL